MPFRIDEPFTTAQALAAGLTRRQLAGPDYRQIFRGVHVSVQARDRPVVQAKAALLLHPAVAVASHATAGRLIGVPIPADPHEHVTVAHESERRRRAGLRCHIAQLKADEIQTVRGVRITSPERLFLDLASRVPLVDLVVTGDWLVRHRFVTAADLRAFCASASTAHAGEARRAASYVRDRVDSPMETRLRMLLVLAGLPEPLVNTEVRDEFGLVSMRLDLSYPGVKVAIEYDGRQHLESAAQWERDVDRRNDLTADGWLRPPTESWRAHFAA